MGIHASGCDYILKERGNGNCGVLEDKNESTLKGERFCDFQRWKECFSVIGRSWDKMNMNWVPLSSVQILYDWLIIAFLILKIYVKKVI